MSTYFGTYLKRSSVEGDNQFRNRPAPNVINNEIAQSARIMLMRSSTRRRPYCIPLQCGLSTVAIVPVNILD